MVNSQILKDLLILSVISSSSYGASINETFPSGECQPTTEYPKRQGNLTLLMSEEHNSLMGFKGYLMYSSEADMTYLPLKFHQLQVRDIGYTHQLNLVGNCANLTLELDYHGWVDHEPGSLSVNRFHEIKVNAGSMGECIINRPKYLDFREDEHFSCQVKRLFSCEPIDYKSNSMSNRSESAIVPTGLQIQELIFEVYGKHNEIFKGQLSKKKKSCLDKHQPERVMTTTTTRYPYYGR